MVGVEAFRFVGERERVEPGEEGKAAAETALGVLRGVGVGVDEAGNEELGGGEDKGWAGGRGEVVGCEEGWDGRGGGRGVDGEDGAGGGDDEEGGGQDLERGGGEGVDEIGRAHV